MTEDAIKGIQEYWAENKLCFNSLPIEDAQDLLKVIILQSVDGNWGDGFVNLARLELLTKAFPRDGLLTEIYRQLLEKCNANMLSISENNYSDIMERCFRDEPLTYKHRGEGYQTWYDVNEDPILKKLIAKHLLLEGAIKGVVYR